MRGMRRAKLAWLVHSTIRGLMEDVISMRRFAAIAAVFFVIAYSCVPALAQAVGQDWPTHPLTMVVPWAAGGGTDIVARVMAHHMSETLGQSVVVENLPGGGGMVGASHVARADPDGYTFILGSRSEAIDMTLYKHPTYSLKDDLAPIVLVADQPTVLVARADFPADGLKDFIAYVKQNAATLKMGAAGVGSTGAIDCALFNGMIGVNNIQPIPYRGSGPAMQDLIGRQFDYFCSISGSAAAPLQGGLVKGIAVFAHERMPSLPDLKTSFEQGLNFEGTTWSGFLAPKATPPALIKKLHDAAVAAMATDDVKDALAKNGTYVIAPDRRSTEYFQSIIGPEIEKNGAPLKAAGVSVD
jgi:tripartite-type tricarboxylate transporter receptor subunit TctC